jgi:hypothetical protein
MVYYPLKKFSLGKMVFPILLLFFFEAHGGWQDEDPTQFMVYIPSYQAQIGEIAVRAAGDDCICFQEHRGNLYCVEKNPARYVFFGKIDEIDPGTMPANSKKVKIHNCFGFKRVESCGGMVKSNLNYVPGGRPSYKPLYEDIEEAVAQTYFGNRYREFIKGMNSIFFDFYFNLRKF